MKLDTKKTIFVGFAFFLICAFWQAYDTMVPKILVDKFGMNQTLSGAVMAIDNVFALFMLPLFGALSDRSKSRMGRRTPFILVGTIAAAIALVLMGTADAAQLKKLSAVTPDNPTAQVTLWDADLTIRTPDGEEVVLQERFTREAYEAISMTDEDGNVTKEYADYVTAARQAYAHDVMKADPSPLILFMIFLLLALISMSTFRSPAVALMPDVTIKPLRSKANAIINLMGAAGGIIILGLGMVFGTGKPMKALMNYIPFFAVVAGLMLVSLVIFLWKVKEPEFVRQAEEESARYGISDQPEEEGKGGERRLGKAELVSLLLILASVVFWYMGYNAVTSKYSVYASSVLNLDYNMSLMIASAAAIVVYIPIGMVASRVGRKKTIMAGVIMLGGAFLAASFLRSGTSVIVMDVLFALAGIGWATINVNSYPMVVELSSGSDVGKYTGFYYTASMAAQTVTPILSGFFMDKIGMTSLFVYATIFVLLALPTMFFVKHGDNKPTAEKSIEAFESMD